MRKVQSQSTSNPLHRQPVGRSRSAEWHAGYIAENNKIHPAARNLVWNMLNRDRRVICPKPEGAFYVYRPSKVLIGKTTKSGVTITDDELCHALLGRPLALRGVWRGLFGL